MFNWREPMKKYLTEEEFNKWKGNEFKHVSDACFSMVRKMARTEGILWILVPLTIAILALIVHILRNGG